MACRRRRAGVSLPVIAVAATAACTHDLGPIRAVYDCRDNGAVAVDYTPETARVTVDGRTWTLPRAVSGSGARYTDGRTLIWDKGGDARLEVEGGAADSCRARK